MRMSARTLFLCLALGAATSAHASDSFRCGSEIIEEGMKVDKVRELCGPPTEDLGDRLVYDRGPDELLIVVHVAPDGTVGDIEAKPRE